MVHSDTCSTQSLPPASELTHSAWGRWFSSEGRIMYPLCKAICPLLHPLGITPNMITISNVFVGLANGYAICAFLLRCRVCCARVPSFTYLRP